MKTYQVTVTRTITVAMTESELVKTIAANEAAGGIAQVSYATILDKPEKRVVVFADDNGYDSVMDCDFEDEADRKALKHKVEYYGVWGFACEQRTTTNGNWEHVDSCGGFVGGCDMLATMREHMLTAFARCQPIDESDAK